MREKISDALSALYYRTKPGHARDTVAKLTRKGLTEFRERGALWLTAKGRARVDALLAAEATPGAGAVGE